MRLVVCQSTSTHHTTPPWPLKVPKRSPLRDHHTLGFESFATENNRSPSRLYLIWVMARSCPCSIRGFYNEITLNYTTYSADYNLKKITSLLYNIMGNIHLIWVVMSLLPIRTIFYEYFSRELKKITKIQAWHVAVAYFLTRERKERKAAEWDNNLDVRIHL